MTSLTVVDTNELISKLWQRVCAPCLSFVNEMGQRQRGIKMGKLIILLSLINISFAFEKCHIVKGSLSGKENEMEADVLKYKAKLLISKFDRFPKITASFPAQGLKKPFHRTYLCELEKDYHICEARYIANDWDFFAIKRNNKNEYSVHDYKYVWQVNDVVVSETIKATYRCQ